MKPKIRVKGKDNWTKKTLSDISKKVVTKNTALKYDVTLTNSAEYGVICQLDFFDHKISNENSISNYYVVEPDDFVYNPRVSVTAPVGPINRNMLGITGVMSPLYYVFKVHDIDKGYLNYYFHTKYWHKFMYDKGNCGARFDRLSIPDSVFVKMPICMPVSKDEQKAIASYFQGLDGLIEATAKKIESLKRVKAASLQSMFPQEGETIPRLRFKGFSGEWTETTIEEICEKKSSSLSETSLGPNIGEFPVYGASGYIQNIPYYQFGTPFIGIVKDGSGVGRSQLYQACASILGTMQCIIAKDNVAIDFMAYLFEAIDFSSYIIGSTIPHIYFKDYSRRVVNVPSYEEQKTIGSFFANLDSQISLQTQRLEKLKQIKAACLDYMFV